MGEFPERKTGRKPEIQLGWGRKRKPMLGNDAFSTLQSMRCPPAE